ncbi:MAG TPA: DNA replication/repair protein RecF [Armatimonadota bacterium]|jgi:DNA replication and repair protein RecF
MQVTRLRLTNFRNYASLDFAPSPGANLLIGGNAQGKTNILEALSILSTSRSPRAGRDAELMRFGEDTMHIATEVHCENANDLTLDVILTPPEQPAPPASFVKTVRINTVKHPRAVDLLGQLQTVGFWPDDVEVVRGEPSGRRRFTNTALCQLSPQYCFHLAQYRRVLEQRNRLLKIIRQRGGHDSGNSLSAWDEQLVSYGARVIDRRIRFVADLNERARDVHGSLTDGTERLCVEYRPNVPLDGGTVEGIQANFQERLIAVRSDEYVRGITLAGPHRDDLTFTLGEADARTYGSLGQQRSVALSLRVAELRLMEEEAGEPCVVLMDEILAELDDDRARRLVDLAMAGRQSFITSTHTRRFPHAFLQDAAVWTVEDATVEACG